MRKIHFIVLFLIGIGFVNAQYTQIPDPGFEQFLIDEGYDTQQVLDGQVLTSDINGIIEVEINNPVPNITDLTGIEDFDSLEFLIIAFTGLVSLDLSGNINLRDIICTFNPQLTHINFNGTDALEVAYIDSNSLTSLDFSNNNLLFSLYANANQLIEADFGSNQNLRVVRLNQNLLTELDVSQNVNLEGLGCTDNLLTELDLTQNVNLEQFGIGSNQLTSLDIRNGNNTLITDFIATNNPDLQCILVDDAAYSTANWPDIDATTTFVETEAACDALSLNDAVLTRYIKVFPNPATSFFVLASPYHTIQKVVLFDLQGKQVKTFEQEEIETPRFDVSELVGGVYFISMEVEGRRVVKKLVVRR